MIKKKRFDRVNGETRICNDCGNDFHTVVPKNRCGKCQYQIQKPYVKEKFVKKPKYPLTPAESKKRWRKVKRELNNCWDSEERKAHYDKVLKEIEENGVLQWILDRRDKESLDVKRIKRQFTIKKEYPNTKDWYE